MHSIIPRLRALILVPTRDLVKQVTKVITPLIKDTKLKVAEIYGKHSLLEEQKRLVYPETK
jgi:ATP-dependent RNA helicase DDX51/DBP6